MYQLSNEVDATVKNAVLEVERYFESNNQILGVLSFTMGLSSLGTENVTFYAWVGLMFVALVWGVSTQRFTRHLRMLQVIEHPRGAPFYILKRSFVAFVGIGFLASVAVGFLTKTGLQWL